MGSRAPDVASSTPCLLPPGPRPPSVQCASSSRTPAHGLGSLHTREGLLSQGWPPKEDAQKQTFKEVQGGLADVPWVTSVAHYPSRTSVSPASKGGSAADFASGYAPREGRSGGRGSPLGLHATGPGLCVPSRVPAGSDRRVHARGRCRPPSQTHLHSSVSCGPRSAGLQTFTELVFPYGWTNAFCNSLEPFCVGCSMVQDHRAMLVGLGSHSEH